ncbi:MAG: hypothetical protein DMG22_02495 [Acidobacteria bacterium]|nr:MAG: hypothetical protein DMG22_02495 [Acidobacteriota bacterium]
MGIYKELLPIDISQSDAARKVVEEICQMRVPMGAPESKIEGAQQPGVEPRVEEILQRDVIEQQVFALCGQIIRNWVHELISDLFAVRMGGPAYFYSFATFAANLRLDARAGASHPSPSMRIDLMLKELSDLHYSSEYSPLQVRSSLESWRRWLETQPLEPEEPPTRVAYWAIKENESKLVEAVRKHTSAFSYGTRAYTEKVKYVVNDLEAGIPPIDRAGDGEAAFDACDLVDILNGAWTTYMFSPEKLESLIECPPPERKLRGVSVLNELVQKAIEASEILRQCHKRSKGGV